MQRSGAVTVLSWVLFGSMLAGCPADEEDDDVGESSEGSSDPSNGSTSPSEGETAPSESEGGSSESEGGSSEGESEASTTGGAPASVLGHVHRDEAAAIAEGNDGIGTLYVGVFSGCDEAAGLAGFAVVQMADVAATDAIVDFTVANLLPGEYDVRVFLDDDGDAALPDAAPDPGDMVADPDPDDGMATCNPVTMAGEDLDVEVALNFTIPAE